MFKTAIQKAPAIALGLLYCTTLHLYHGGLAPPRYLPGCPKLKSGKPCRLWENSGTSSLWRKGSRWPGEELEIKPVTQFLKGKEHIGEGINRDNDIADVALSQGNYGPGDGLR